VVVLGTDESIAEVVGEIKKNPALGFDVVGSCPSGDNPVVICRELEADTLIVTGGSLSSSWELRRIGWALGDSDIDLIVVPSLLDVAGPRIHMRPVAGLPLMHIEPPQVARAMKWGKTIFDRVGSVVMLVMLAPVLLGIALAVKVETPGPAFYRHRRIGAQGREFGVWKFRSMVTDADVMQTDLVAANGGVALLFKVKDDPRVTRVGRFIRRYSLDELPQLINVMVGQMSLVGPRPQVADEVAAYDESAHRRLLVRPGITGLWQVSGRSNLTWGEAVRLDLSYVDNWSMTGDIVILAKTIRAVLRHDGAY
jgi:exopolysaccharide biosynthesis polyprenyl glycosylphosphotransferase